MSKRSTRRRLPDGKRQSRKPEPTTVVKRPLPWLGLALLALAAAGLVGWGLTHS